MRIIKMVIPALIITSFLAIPFVGKDVAGKDRSFRGKVIYVTDEYIEAKSGRKELVLYFTEKSKVILIDGTTGTSKNIELCQEIRASYTKHNDKNLVNTVKVLKKSYCK